MKAHIFLKLHFFLQVAISFPTNYNLNSISIGTPIPRNLIDDKKIIPFTEHSKSPINKQFIYKNENLIKQGDFSSSIKNKHKRNINYQQVYPRSSNNVISTKNSNVKRDKIIQHDLIKKSESYLTKKGPKDKDDKKEKEEKKEKEKEEKKEKEKEKDEKKEKEKEEKIAKEKEKEEEKNKKKNNEKDLKAKLDELTNIKEKITSSDQIATKTTLAPIAQNDLKLKTEADAAAIAKAQKEADEAATAKAKAQKLRLRRRRLKAQEEADAAAIAKSQKEADEAATAKAKAQKEADAAAAVKAQEEADAAAIAKAQKEADEAATAKAKAQKEADAAAAVKAQEEVDTTVKPQKEADLAAKLQEDANAVAKPQIDAELDTDKAQEETNLAAKPQIDTELDAATKTQNEKETAAKVPTEVESNLTQSSENSKNSTIEQHKENINPDDDDSKNIFNVGSIDIYGDLSSADAEQFLELVNKVRSEKNKSPLVFNSGLLKACYFQSKYMSDTKKATHNHIGFGDTIKRISFTGGNCFNKGCAENVSNNSGSYKDVFNEWINTPIDFENILGDYHGMGISSYKGYWTQNFN
ncbi:hypothetical protein BB561_004517 [Smittium simulii]|uniref:SCP domain-containing protein n=1 Tax=Smittium simulii TaxID=133385 RepID=A0A2T9YFZ0_9FUNG|nr:hypothetical protein BB561_004517 [Smittium simulii]